MQPDLVSRDEMATQFAREIRRLGDESERARQGGPAMTTGQYSRGEWIGILDAVQAHMVWALGIILGAGHEGAYDTGYAWFQAHGHL